MQLLNQYKNNDGTTSTIIYEDTDYFGSLEFDKIKQVYAVCLCKGKMVIVFHGKRKDWTLVGGSIESGESIEQCLRREIREESNMKVLSFKPIGYQKIIKGEEYIYQLRFVCEVEPYGEFISDPDGKIIEIKLIDPKEYKKYFDWGEIGERIVARGLELLFNN